MIKKALEYCKSWKDSLISVHKKIDFSPPSLIRYALFSAGYSLIVLFFTFLIGFLPVEYENKYYDKIQDLLTIDSKSNLHYGIYQPVLDKMVFVNIDKESFDFENQRTDRKKLAAFIDSLSRYKSQIKCIYLDYEIPVPQTKEDSVLIGNLMKLEDKLVVPYGLKSKTDHYQILGNAINKNDVIAINLPVMGKVSKGYYFGFKLPDTKVSRFTKIMTDDGAYSSLAYELFLKYTGEKPKYSATLAETKYILRNKPDHQAVKQYDMRDLMENQAYFPVLFKDDCIVVISMFDLIHKNNLEYGKQKLTPVDDQLPGAVVQVNNFLCLLYSDFLRTSLLWVFMINFIICFITLPYSTIKPDLPSQENVIVKYINKYLIAIGIFVGIGILLFMYADMKLSLGITIFAFPYIASLYKKIIKS